MKGIYLVGNEKWLSDGISGVSKKINSQINCFNVAGLNCRKKVQRTGLYNPKNYFFKLLYALPFSNINPVWEYSSEYDDIDYLYIRKPLFFNFASIRLLKRIKKNGTKIIIEIPTYPYEKEYLYLSGKILMLKEKPSRIFLHKYVDKIFYMGETNSYKSIWNIPSIRLLNGIDTSSVKQVVPIDHDGINLICVSTCYYWHGYERLIDGLTLYMKENHSDNVNIYIVGDGYDLPLYKKKAIDGGVQNHVHFCGILNSDSLNEIYSIADISVGSLGNHRKGLSVTSELKSRESYAKGIPYTCACKLDVFVDNKCDYFLELPANESPINICDITAFYHRIYDNVDRNKICEEVRKIAETYMDMKVVMQPVVQCILDK